MINGFKDLQKLVITTLGLLLSVHSLHGQEAIGGEIYTKDGSVEKKALYDNR